MGLRLYGDSFLFQNTSRIMFITFSESDQLAWGRKLGAILESVQLYILILVHPHSGHCAASFCLV